MAYTKKVDTNIKENEKNVVDSIDITNLEKENMQLKEKMLEIEKQMNQLLSGEILISSMISRVGFVNI